MTTRARQFVRRLALPLAVAGLAFAASPAGAQSLSKEQQTVEQEACVARLDQQVKAPKKACRCMVEGLVETMDIDSYLALAKLLQDGEESESGTAAHEAARQIVAGCLPG